MNDTQMTARSEFSPYHGLEKIGAACRDLKEGFSAFRLALALGWLDIKMRYRGSLLGPFWITITMAVTVLSLGMLYSRLFHMDMHRYLPFLSLSIVLWGYMSGILSEGANVFSDQRNLIHSLRSAYSVYALRVIVRNALVLLHNLAVVIITCLYYHIVPHHAGALISGIGLWFVDSLAAILVLGVVGARFADVAPIMSSLLQAFFFITPIIWRPELATFSHDWLLLDPFYPLMDIVRAPLLGDAIQPDVWLAALAHSAVLVFGAGLLFSTFRARIAYWV